MDCPRGAMRSEAFRARTLLGKSWWDEKRYQAYAKHDYHCWACGIHKFDAKYHQWLEGHECYIINYKDGIMELKEIVALCHSCHNFIHSGRLLQLYIKGDISKAKALDILNHGFHILLANRLKPFVAAIICWCSLMGYNKETILDLSKRAMLRGRRCAVVRAIAPRLTNGFCWMEWLAFDHRREKILLLVPEYWWLAKTLSRVWTESLIALAVTSHAPRTLTILPRFAVFMDNNSSVTDTDYSSTFCGVHGH